jgi:hypothetical protein
MNRKPLNQPRKEPKPEIPAKGFEMFKNGMLNTRTPHNYNWALGNTTPAPHESRKPIRASAGLPLQTINGQRVVQ